MTRLSSLITVALALLTAYAGPAAAAYNRAFCVTVSVTYTDSSNTGVNWTLLGGSPEAYEDNWWTPTAAREARGARYELRGTSGQVLMAGYLGDGFGAQAAGCTPNYTGTTRPYSFWIASYGSIQSNWQYTYDPYQQPDTLYSIFPLGQPSETGLPYAITLSPSGTTAPRVWSGYIAGAYALYRHAGGETLNYFQFYLCQCVKASTCPPWAGACVGGFCQTGGAVCIETCDEVGTPFEGCVCAFDDAGGCVASNNTNYSLDAGNGLQRTSVLTNTGMQRKYVIVHEMGHIMAANVTNGYANGGDCTGDDAEPCHEEGGGSHAFWSREFDRCAFKEAFADFYAADVWNDHNEDNCAFKYYKGNASTTAPSWDGAPFDCAGDDGPDQGTGPDDFTNRYTSPQVAYIEKCDETPFFDWDYFGHGTELDWMRVFWNMHTDGASPPSYTTMVRWIRDCGVDHGTFGNSTTYTTLASCAEDEGGTLEANWSAAANVHTIDWSSN